MGRIALGLLVLSGCSQLFGLDGPIAVDASSGDDATDDAPMGDALACYGHTNICVTSMPSDRNFGDQTVDTRTGCDAIVEQSVADVPLCVLIGRNVLVTGTLKAVGTRPLVLVATETLSITMTGKIDVASHTAASVIGAGASPTICVDGENGTGISSGDAGGGAGASFQGKGGDGGDGDVAGGNAAVALASPPTFVRAGCKGRQGGLANGAIAYDGGEGGGAVVLVAGIRIEITGDINASGGGGKGGAIGGNGDSGGAGGGSGGLIWLDAPTVIVTGDVFANGGGGGGSSAGVVPGGTGGTSTDAMTGGSVGSSSGAGAGGIGSGGSSLDGAPGVTAAPGGGGGGGGGGFIQIYSQSPQLSLTISPPPILM